MTMAFRTANAAQLTAAPPGTKVAFEFVERSPGEWVITRIDPAGPAAGKPPPAPTADPHKGH